MTKDEKELVSSIKINQYEVEIEEKNKDLAILFEEIERIENQIKYHENNYRFSLTNQGIACPSSYLKGQLDLCSDIKVLISNMIFEKGFRFKKITEA